ncbi:hypothetical protein BsWGS_02897 [Bradybaena similaris]
MLIWWLLSPLFVAVTSSCVTGVSSNFSTDCTKKERGLNSFLWTVQRSPPAYLFGTIHVPYTRVWEWIPPNSKLAFSESDSAIFELDLTNPYTLTALADCQMLPAGESLSNLLPEELYARLQRHLEYVRSSMHYWMSDDQKRKGLFADYLFNAITGNWRRKRPVWVMLMVNSLTESDVKSRGIPVLDLYLAQQAERDGKVTGAVERVEEQCVPLNQLNLSQVLFALNQTLSQHESLRDQSSRPHCSSDALIQHYNCGDLNSLMFSRDTTQVPALVNSSLPPQELHKALMIEQYFQHELIDKRNARMAERVAYLLQQHPVTSFFFAFGAGHFLGNETVIDRLRRTGLQVEHTGPGENITSLNRVRTKHSRKSRKFVLSDDFPQPSDVIYGDIQYLFAKSLNADRNFKGANKKRKNSDKKNTFNDLWVRTDQIRPRYLQQMGETSFIQGISTDQTDHHGDYSQRPGSGALKPTSCRGYSTTVILLCAILTTWRDHIKLDFV